jgi:hypothetical protein
VPIITRYAVVQKSWINGHPEEFKEVCPFDLVPGSNGRWLLWWPEEKTWIASFPSLEAALFVIFFSCRFCVKQFLVRRPNAQPN